MSFISFEFLLFVLVLVALYFVVPEKTSVESVAAC